MSQRHHNPFTLAPGVSRALGDTGKHPRLRPGSRRDGRAGIMLARNAGHTEQGAPHTDWGLVPSAMHVTSEESRSGTPGMSPDHWGRKAWLGAPRVRGRVDQAWASLGPAPPTPEPGAHTQEGTLAMKHPKTSRCFCFSCGRVGHERCSAASGPGHFSRRQGQWRNPCCEFLLLRIKTFLCLISISSFAREGGVEAVHSPSSPCFGSEFHQECFESPLCVSRPP